MVFALSLFLPVTSQAADCGADLKKAEAEWQEIQKKEDVPARRERAIDRFLSRAREGYKAGKNKYCAGQLERMRGRWQEFGWR